MAHLWLGRGKDYVRADQESAKIVCKISTSHWCDNNGIYTKRYIRFLKRKSTGFNYILEDANLAGADSVIRTIVNLNSCADGLYLVTLTDYHTDWETGIVDDWSYRLIPYTGDNN